MMKLQAFDSSYFRGKNHFEDDGLKIIYYFSQCKDSYYISSWKSKGLSDESIKSRCASNNIIDPSLDYLGTKTRV